MELRQLKYFVAVADTLNFSRAAESMFVSQSALSKQISELEDELGVLLLKRDKRNVELTEAGMVLLDQAHSLLLQIDKIPPLVKSHAASDGPSVMIGIDAKCDRDPIAHRALAEAVYVLRQKNPGLRALFFIRSQSEIIQALLSGELDLGLILTHEPTIDKSFERSLLSTDRMAIVLRSEEDIPSDIDSVRALLNSPRGLIMTRRDLPELSHIVRILNDLGCTPDVHYTEDRASMIFNVESGDGMVILPKSVIERANHPYMKAVPLPVDSATLYSLAIWRKDASVTTKQIVYEVQRQLKQMNLK